MTRSRKLSIRPLRKLVPALPANIGHGETVLLLRTDTTGKVVEQRLFVNYHTSFRTAVSGFTHYARLPFYL